MEQLKIIKKLTLEWNPGVMRQPTGILLHGKPGCGSTLVARRIWKLLADAAQPTSVIAERCRIYSMCGLVDYQGREPFAKLEVAPLRAPHHTVSKLGMTGSIGTIWPHPGEVHLAHGGLLFLDEAEEFRHDVLDTVAAAWIDGYYPLASGIRPMKIPSAFFLVAAVHDMARWERGVVRLKTLVPIALDPGDADEIAEAIPL